MSNKKSKNKHYKQLKKIKKTYLTSNSKGHKFLKFFQKTKIKIIFAFILLATGSLAFLLKDIPNPNTLTKQPPPVSTKILDRNGKLLYEVYLEQNRTPIKISDLPPYVMQATISIEDKNFYKHFGLDFQGIIRAAFKTLSGQRLEGGSTITQQLVKIAVLSDSRRTITRKIREAVLAILTELTYNKDAILELYLNHVPYGGTVYGIETASNTFFGKSAKDLTIAEAALLAGLPQAPTRYSPFGAQPELAKKRQEAVLKQMLKQGYINQEQFNKSKAQKLVFASNQTNIEAPHFSLYIRDLLVKKYGEDLINRGGLRVTTSLDLDLQKYVQASLSAEIKKLKKLKVGNGAALITKPNTGEILAMIGSADYFDIEHDGNVNLTNRFRQPGSSIKPINYAVGLLKGWTASTTYLDYPICFKVTGQKPYCPKNYDNSFHGPVQMRFALGNSYNIPAVKQLALNGVDAMIATASAMGINNWTDPSRYGLSLTLGGGEVTMMELATAFGTFANSGITVPLNPILKVETYTAKILEEHNPQDIADLTATLPQNWQDFFTQKNNQINCPTDISNCPRVSLPEEVAYIISHILLDNNARAGSFGYNSKLVIPKKTVSVKTGTTNDLRDNWTIGYTPDYLTAVWVGNNDNTPMSRVASGVTGASPIWNSIMKKVLQNQPDHFPTQPKGIVSKQVCTLTGLLATQENQCETRTEIFAKQALPPAQIQTRKQIWVRRSDKYPLLPGDNTIDLDLEEHTVISDPFSKEFCIDCAYPTNDKGKIIWPTTTIDYNQFQLNPPLPKTYLQ